MENKKENRAFNEMYIAAKKRLEGKNPIEIAKITRSVQRRDFHQKQ